MAAKSNSPSKKGKEQPPKETGTSTATIDTTPKLASKQTNEKETKPMSDTPSIITFSQDIADAEAVPPFPKGDFPFTIRGAEKKTSGKGNDYLSVACYFDPDCYPADWTDGDPDGTTLYYQRVMVSDTPQNRFKLKKFLSAIGGKMSKTLDPNELLGLNGVATIDHEEWEGEPRATIKKILEA